MTEQEIQGIQDRVNAVCETLIQERGASLLSEMGPQSRRVFCQPTIEIPIELGSECWDD